MINVNELRIGNIINKFGEVAQLTIGDFYLIAVDKEEFVKGLDPIPLTPEILEKCGFELEGEETYRHDKGRVALQLEQQDYTDDTYDFHCAIRFDIGMPFNDLLIGVQHLHQLQNLYFALTGSELEIKSPL